MKVNDIARVVNGLSLVAKEAARRQLLSDGMDLQFLIKTTLLSATDLTGLTKGRFRRFQDVGTAADVDPNSETNSNAIKQSVVHFVDSSPQPGQIRSPESNDIITQDSEVPGVPVYGLTRSDVDVSPPLEAAGISADADPHLSSQKDEPSPQRNYTAGGAASQQTVIKRQQRKPRERRVPSTPFSRALG